MKTALEEVIEEKQAKVRPQIINYYYKEHKERSEKSVKQASPIFDREENFRNAT